MECKYCENCQFLNITENEQKIFNAKAINHKCTLFNKKLRHKDQINIERLDKCIKLKIKETDVIDDFLKFLNKYIDLNNLS